MSDNDQKLPDLRYVRELAKVFRTYGLDEIEIETGEQRILLRRGDASPVGMAAAPGAALPAAAPLAVVASVSAEVSAKSKEDEGDFITSPFVGTFYSAPRPDVEAFVKTGETISKGKPVCIVEAMKLFNEIEAEFPCIIEEMLISDGDSVEFGARLFKVRKL